MAWMDSRRLGGREAGQGGVWTFRGDHRAKTQKRIGLTHTSHRTEQATARQVECGPASTAVHARGARRSPRRAGVHVAKKTASPARTATGAREDDGRDRRSCVSPKTAPVDSS